MRNRSIRLLTCVIGVIATLACSSCSRNSGRTESGKTERVVDLAREVDINKPAVTIYTESSGIRIIAPGAPPEENPRLVLAVWGNGWMVWSKHGIDGGKPYLTGQTDAKNIEGLVQELIRRKAFEDKAINTSYFGPDSSYSVIEIRFGGRRLKMESWHELYEQNPLTVALSTGLTDIEGTTRENRLAAEPASYKRFRATWALIRKTTTAWIPKDAQPYSGKRPSLPLPFEEPKRGRH